VDFFTHVVVGALMYLLFLKDITLDYLILAMFFSILPDLDIFIAPLKRISTSNYLEHRAGSHSFVIGIILSAIIGIIYSFIMNKAFIIVWIIALSFYGLHVFMDLLTTTKIPCLFPLSKKEYCFYIEKAGSLFTMLNSIIFIFVLVLLYLIPVDIFTFRFVINLYTALYITYYFYRTISKVWISATLETNQKYFPGVLPFYYTILNLEIVNNEVSSSIERKSHFSKSKEIDNMNANLNTGEMTLFEKAVALINANYYFAKWAMFPIFIRNDGMFSIRFFFLETMMRNRSMHIQYDFGVVNQQLIGVRQGYGSIQP